MVARSVFDIFSKFDDDSLTKNMKSEKIWKLWRYLADIDFKRMTSFLGIADSNFWKKSREDKLWQKCLNLRNRESFLL